MLHQTFSRRGLRTAIVSAVLLASLTAGVLPAGCGGGGGGCTLIGCGPTLTVNFEVSVPQTYDVEVSLPEGQRIRLHCAGNSSKTIANSIPGSQAMCLWNEGLWLENFTPREVTVTLISENHRVSQTFTPTYEAYHVNGPNCPGDCQKATVAFTKPLDTSPKALAQTATARPVMLVINQALLQATMLAATAQALDAKIFVAPATATALHGQVAGNLATIEALRPTANSLHIVLMERPVRPTDAPEATLFAQANEAAKAAAHIPVGTPPPGTP